MTFYLKPIPDCPFLDYQFIVIESTMFNHFSPDEVRVLEPVLSEGRLKAVHDESHVKNKSPCSLPNTHIHKYNVRTNIEQQEEEEGIFTTHVVSQIKPNQAISYRIRSD